MQRIIRRSTVRASLALAALAGIATTASTALADDCCRWELKVTRKAALSNEFEVQIWAHIPDDAFAIAAGGLDLLADNITWTTFDLVGPLSGAPLSWRGWPQPGGEIRDILGGQLHFPPEGIIADQSNPMLMWEGEFVAEGDGYRTLRTRTQRFDHYIAPDSSISVACDVVREDVRTIFVGPIPFGSVLASPLEGTRGQVRRGTLFLEPETPSAEPFGTALAVEDATWAPGTSFFHSLFLGDLPSGARADLLWFPRWECAPWFGQSIAISMTKSEIIGEPIKYEIVPDFRSVGVPRVPLTLKLGDRVVAEPILGSEQAISLFNPCTSLTWCYVLNEFDQLVLALKCESPFDIEVGGLRHTVDLIELDPQQGPGAAGGMDRVEIQVEGAPSLTVSGAGFLGGCRVDCDGDGDLTLFDFLCFQNLFVSGDLAADFDGDGRLTIFDFLLFQNEFLAGCP